MIRLLQKSDWPAFMAARRMIDPNLKTVGHAEVYVADRGDGFEGTATLRFNGETAELDGLAVLHGSQGQCLSRLLVDRVVMAAHDRGFDRIVAYPIDDGVAAGLKAMGFKPEGHWFTRGTM